MHLVRACPAAKSDSLAKGQRDLARLMPVLRQRRPVSSGLVMGVREAGTVQIPKILRTAAAGVDGATRP